MEENYEISASDFDVAESFQSYFSNIAPNFDSAIVQPDALAEFANINAEYYNAEKAWALWCEGSYQLLVCIVSKG